MEQYQYAAPHNDGAAPKMSIRGELVRWTSSNLTTLLLFVSTFLLLRYYDSCRRFYAQKQGNTLRTPPTVPHLLPLLGSFPILYVWSPIRFVIGQRHIFQSLNPIRVKALHYEFYVVQGADNIKTLFKNSWASTSTAFSRFALGYAFGLPAQPLSLYDKDDSGSGHVPHQHSKVEPRNRIDYRDHQTLVRLLEGKGLSPLSERFANNITERLRDLYRNIGSSARGYADLMRFVGDETTTSTLNALCGPYLLKLNPGFLDDFWVFDRNLQTFLQGIPQILAPRAYASRKRVINAVKAWEEHARRNFTPSAIGPDGDDVFWGSSFFRERQSMFLEMDGYEPEHIASNDFGFIWATRNSSAATSWNVYEIYRDPELLAAVRREVDSCMLENSDGQVQFDMDRLLHLPLLQAVYAETLRLRMHFYIVRMPDKTGMNINNWLIPRRKIIVTSTTAAHLDPKAWRSEFDDEHPIDTFWPGRFLKTEKNGFENSKIKTNTSAFSTREFDGSWIPYGGGPRQCPGRHFAKRQILLTTALIVALFNCEISETAKNVAEDLSLGGFGSGISHPACPVPFRLQRRETASS